MYVVVGPAGVTAPQATSGEQYSKILVVLAFIALGTSAGFLYQDLQSKIREQDNRISSLVLQQQYVHRVSTKL